MQRRPDLSHVFKCTSYVHCCRHIVGVVVDICILTHSPYNTSIMATTPTNKRNANYQSTSVLHVSEPIQKKTEHCVSERVIRKKEEEEEAEEDDSEKE